MDERKEGEKGREVAERLREKEREKERERQTPPPYDSDEPIKGQEEV